MRFRGDRLQKLRVSRKFDQHRLAEAVRKQGVSMTQSKVSRIENGKEPSGSAAIAFAKTLGVTLEELYDEDEEAASMPTQAERDFSSAVDALISERVRQVVRESLREVAV